jgi:DNA-binding CsgD family transcriptional regulator
VRFAREHGSATAALDATGINLPDITRFDGIEADYLRLLGQPALGDPVRQGIALGFLAGRTARRNCERTAPDPTAFLMDQDLVVRAATGQSILRLPWFEEQLFIGRQLPDIQEIPTPIRSLAVQKYRTALTGERTDYSFTSYGHTYSVDAVPIRDDEGSIAAVLAVAVPRQTQQDGLPQLTAREREVLTLASQGMNYSQIATQLFLTHATVKTHLAHIYAKLRVRDKAVAVALRSGLID